MQEKENKKASKTQHALKRNSNQIKRNNKTVK